MEVFILTEHDEGAKRSMLVCESLEVAQAVAKEEYAIEPNEWQHPIWYKWEYGSNTLLYYTIERKEVLTSN